MRVRQRQRPRIQRLHLLRPHVDHLLDILQPPLDQQKRLLRNQQPVPLKKRRRHHHIRDPRLVLQAQENKSFRRARPLPANHHPGHRHPLPVLPRRQIARAQHPLQLRPQQIHGMPPHG